MPFAAQWPRYHPCWRLPGQGILGTTPATRLYPRFPFAFPPGYRNSHSAQP
ncbi:hypothetical protein ACFFMH_20605 [Rufibacter immobilis]|uniref:hypothetical protein n=1 Tax=Rufibacter immobilis TaxID=1348778 RepID=UPI0035E9BCD3